MPKLFIHSRQGTFTADARHRIAAALTDLGVACERLADTPKVRSGVWVFFTEHAPDAVFSAGHVASDPIMSMIAYTIEGGLDAESRKRFIAEATAILGKHAGITSDRVPVYVSIQETPEIDWGMYGSPIHLAALRVAS